MGTKGLLTLLMTEVFVEQPLASPGSAKYQSIWSNWGNIFTNMDHYQHIYTNPDQFLHIGTQIDIFLQICIVFVDQLRLFLPNCYAFVLLFNRLDPISALSDPLF